MEFSLYERFIERAWALAEQGCQTPVSGNRGNWGVRTADGQGLIWDCVCPDRQGRCLLVLVLGKLMLGSQGTMAFV